MSIWKKLLWIGVAALGTWAVAVLALSRGEQISALWIVSMSGLPPRRPGPRAAPEPLPVPTVTGPAMVPLPFSRPAFTRRGPVPVPEPITGSMAGRLLRYSRSF